MAEGRVVQLHPPSRAIKNPEKIFSPWKSPAGTEATMAAVWEQSLALT